MNIQTHNRILDRSQPRIPEVLRPGSRKLGFKPCYIRFVLHSRLQGLALAAGALILAFSANAAQITPQDDSSAKISIVRAITQFIHERLPLPPEDLLIETPGLEKLADDHVQYDVIKVLPSQKPIRKGVQTIRCGFFLNSQLLKKIQVRIRVRTFQTVVVSSSNHDRHTVLLLEGLKLERRETTSLTRKIHDSSRQVAGLRTKRMVRSGEIIFDDLVEPIPVVALGSEVEIHFKKGSLNIVLPGIAREDGQPGRKVRVHCLENKRNYRAEVVDSGSVIVNL